MDKQSLEKLLVECGYPAHMIEGTAKKIMNFQPRVAQAFQVWHAGEQCPDITVEGYSFADLTGHYGMKPIGALITLDWLLRDPQSATAALRRGVK